MRSTTSPVVIAMDDRPRDPQSHQPDLYDTDGVRSLLDQLLEDSKLYTKSKDFKDLLDFVVRLRNFAPFNAMLLQVQKPGLSYAASARDWRERFGRHPKESARPLLILWPFGPVTLVYDVLDTDGEALPIDVASFFARGAVDETKLKSFVPLLLKKHIEWYAVDTGDRRAGLIRVLSRSANEKDATQYRMHINRNHNPPTQFSTVVHELAHLCLGHLGPDKKLNMPERPRLDHAQQEFEAESVAYLVCERNGVHLRSQTYLSDFARSDTTINPLDIYQVMRAAGQVETLLGLAAHMRYDVPTTPRN